MGAIFIADKIAYAKRAFRDEELALLGAPLPQFCRGIHGRLPLAIIVRHWRALDFSHVPSPDAVLCQLLMIACKVFNHVANFSDARSP